ncbi:MAG: MotA/TolQ/ExbB proton channel family protein [Candidatus Azotimanducaceae bacterium]
MFELIGAGGWLMLPIIFCSVISLAIVIERSWVLRRENILPRKLLRELNNPATRIGVDNNSIVSLGGDSFLGFLFISAFAKKNDGYDAMRTSAENAASFVEHELLRNLGTLGTIAAITPLLGLLGTVIGMITVFGVVETAGGGFTSALAGGISQALITTAAGLIVAIPTLFFQRYFERKVDELLVFLAGDCERFIELLSKK